MMDERIKKAADSIRMPEDMRIRVADHCRARLSGSEWAAMKRHRRPMTALAVLLIGIVASSAAFAASGALSGFFRDIKRWDGAIIGTSFEQATNDIILSATVSGEELTLCVEFADPQALLCRESEQLGIAAYGIVDEAGKMVHESKAAEPVPVAAGKAAIPIDLKEIDAGSYRMVIDAFVSEKKADQPLNISGRWEIPFVKP